MHILRIQTNCRLATIALLTVGVAHAGLAQHEPASAHAVTWCAHPAPKTEWRRQTAYLALGEHGRKWAPNAEPASTNDTVGLPKSALGLVLETVTRPFFHASGLDTVESPASLPPGEPRYRAKMLLGHVDFRLRGDGRMDSVVLHDVVDSVLALDLRSALQMASEGGRIPAFGDTTAHRTFQLSAELYADTDVASWPSFTIDAPTEKQAIPRTDNPELRYQPDLMAWNADLTLEFIIEHDGTVRRGSIKSLPPSESFARSPANARSAFARFEALTIAGMKNWKYLPAESHGCLVPQLVQQPFSFRVSKE